MFQILNVYFEISRKNQKDPEHEKLCLHTRFEIQKKGNTNLPVDFVIEKQILGVLRQVVRIPVAMTVRQRRHQPNEEHIADDLA